MVELTVDLIRRNEQHQDIYIRPVAYLSDQIIGVRLHNMSYDLLITSEPMGNYVDIDGLKCNVSSWRRIDDNAVPARAKILGAYVNSAFAKTEALQNGFDEAIMLTNEGHVSEGSAENIFLVINGELVTPAPSENILLGITRATVIELARRELGLTTTERQIDRTELYSADEVFLVGTGAQIAPVVAVDRRPVGTGKVGPISEQLQRIYFDVVRGANPKYREDWCTPVFVNAAVK
jgi:branched-chain amino acid aminotransferase